MRDKKRRRYKGKMVEERQKRRRYKGKMVEERQKEKEIQMEDGGNRDRKESTTRRWKKRDGRERETEGIWMRTRKE
jgi:hypothetical protein